MMAGFFLYDDGGEFTAECALMAGRFGFPRNGSPQEALFSLAPRWTRRIPPGDLIAPALGVLIFHPSALPYGRGPAAIPWAVSRGERVSAATWFWADAGLDTGDVCEQEVVVLHPAESPGRAYYTRFVPAGLRALQRAPAGIQAGEPRRVPQEEALASFDPAFARGGGTAG